jgi:hypothetical protein
MIQHLQRQLLLEQQAVTRDRIFVPIPPSYFEKPPPEGFRKPLPDDGGGKANGDADYGLRTAAGRKPTLPRPSHYFVDLPTALLPPG